MKFGITLTLVTTVGADRVLDSSILSLSGSMSMSSSVTWKDVNSFSPKKDPEDNGLTTRPFERFNPYSPRP